jgi:hypothetical protein
VPVSCAQERFWLIKRLRLARKPADELPMQIRLSGRLDVVALSRALEEISARHESLRTRIRAISGTAYQVIDPVRRLNLPLIDLCGVGEERREAELRSRLQQIGAETFDLREGPLLRVALLHLATDDHLLALKVHHLVFDGWSLGVVLRELGALYTGFSSGGTRSVLPDPQLQYADYAIWQRRWLAGELLQRQIGYWERRLSGLRPLCLPADRPRPLIRSYGTARIAIELSNELTVGLQALGRRSGATVYMVLLAAFQWLLSRWSGQTDVAVGSLVAGRVHPRTEGLVGFFLNILVMRVDLSGAPQWETVLRQVRDTVLEALAHQDVPFERLVLTLGREWEAQHHHPLFQVMFVYQNVPQLALALPGVTTSVSVGERRLGRYDLMLELWERPHGLSGHFEYSTELFEAGRIEELRAQFAALLRVLVARGSGSPFESVGCHVAASNVPPSILGRGSTSH